MPAKIDVICVQDREVARKLEFSLSQCFVDRPDSEGWIVTVKSWTADFFEVVVQGGNLRRQKLFFQSGNRVVEEIHYWVGLYLPLQSPQSSGESSQG